MLVGLKFILNFGQSIYLFNFAEIKFNTDEKEKDNFYISHCLGFGCCWDYICI